MTAYDMITGSENALNTPDPGRIDELKVYSCALTDAEILAECNT